MGGCCEKRANAGIAKIETKGAAGITSNEIPAVLDYVSRYFSQSTFKYFINIC